jgi:hypothetical protein
VRNVLSELSDPGGGASSCSEAVRCLMKILGPLRIVEIGTSYGTQLAAYSAAERLVAVDPMYDWVPDVSEDEGFDPAATDERKVASWRSNLSDAGLGERGELVLGNSYLVHADPEHAAKFAGSQVLVVDGCHHPGELVLRDYTNFRRFLTPSHYVVWDDSSYDDVKWAVARSRSLLESEGLRVDQVSFRDSIVMFVTPS